MLQKLYKSDQIKYLNYHFVSFVNIKGFDPIFGDSKPSLKFNFPENDLWQGNSVESINFSVSVCYPRFSFPFRLIWKHVV